MSDPGAAGTKDPVALSAREASERVRAGELAAGELFETYRRRAAGSDLNAFTWLAESAPAVGDGGFGDQPLGGVPLAVKDLFCT